MRFLKKNNIRIQTAYLFGLYANGNFNKDSDIDLALVSEDFSGDSWEDNKTLRNFKHLVSWDLSPLPFTPSEFFASSFIKDEVIKKGILIT